MSMSEEEKKKVECECMKRGVKACIGDHFHSAPTVGFVEEKCQEFEDKFIETLHTRKDVYDFIRTALNEARQDARREVVEEIADKIRYHFNGYGGTLGATESDLLQALRDMR